MNGLVIDYEEGTIKLRCSVFIQGENYNWLGKIFPLTVIMQVINAETKGTLMGDLLDLKPCRSSHPHSGTREDPPE